MFSIILHPLVLGWLLSVTLVKKNGINQRRVQGACRRQGRGTSGFPVLVASNRTMISVLMCKLKFPRQVEVPRALNDIVAAFAGELFIPLLMDAKK
jgi:hypothetical protein